MSNNNTKYIVEDVIILGCGQLKKDLSLTPLMKQYFPNANCITTEDINNRTGERVYEEYLNRDNINKHPIISFLQELVERGKDECLVFGLDDVKRVYSNYELKHLISNDEDLFEEYKQKNKDTGCKTIHTGKLYQDGKMIGIK